MWDLLLSSGSSWAHRSSPFVFLNTIDPRHLFQYMHFYPSIDLGYSYVWSCISCSNNWFTTFEIAFLYLYCFTDGRWINLKKMINLFHRGSASQRRTSYFQCFKGSQRVMKSVLKEGSEWAIYHYLYHCIRCRRVIILHQPVKTVSC